ncbi:hypothetical protein L7F22_016523 [Adiantum nelumboides]|nr:hypothetical protein [Adiantum nelumboides]
MDVEYPRRWPRWSPLRSSDSPVVPLNHQDESSVNGMESLDYEVIENLAYREDQASRGRLHYASYVTLKWLFVLLIGVATGFSAFFINIAVENFSGWKFSATFTIMEHSYFAGFLVYSLFNVALVFSSVYIVTKFAPAAAGSGIPEIKGYLNGIDTPGILLFRTLVGKIFGSIGSVGGGLALGKEGPLVHTGACIASLVGQGGSTKHFVNWRWLQVFKNDRDRRDLVTCGCAAGVSAAFRAPVGGVLFALEEVTSWWRSQLLWRVFFTSAVVAVVVRSAMGWCTHGNCGHFGSGGFIIWDVSGGQDDYSFYELFPMAMVGVIGGLLGALFNQLTLYLSSWRRNTLHKRGDRVKIVEACLVSLLTSILSFGLPLLTKCTPCPDAEKYPDIVCPRPEGTYGNYVNFHCSSRNEYNDLATIFFNTQDDAIRNLFSTKTIHEYSASSLLTFLIVLARVLHRYATQIHPNRIEIAGYRPVTWFHRRDKSLFSIEVSLGQFGLEDTWDYSSDTGIAIMADRTDDVTEEVSSSQGQQTHEVGESSRPPQTEDKIFRTQLVTAVAMFTQVMQNPRFMALLQTPRPSQSIGNKKQKSEPAKAQKQALFFSLAVITFGTAVPAGQFVPGIMIGSTYGRLVGMFVVNVYKKLDIDEGTYALLGAASFLGGSMRMTVSLCVIMVEITNNLKLLPLIMLVLLISKAVGDAFNAGFYEEQAHMKGIPLLESRPKHFMRKTQAKETCQSQKVVYFSRVSKVGHIVSVLQSNNHHGFPVIDKLQSGETVVIGLILRSYLLVLLQSRTDFQASDSHEDVRGQFTSRHSVTDFVKPVSSKGLSIQDIFLNPQELELYIDLEPFVNPSPYIVPEDMSLTKVYNLFRQLGLRHVLVVPRPSQVVGVITRKDLISEPSEDKEVQELSAVRMSRSNPLLQQLLV